MIRRLRLRFILLSMLSVLLVLVTIMSAINILNYREVVVDADTILDYLQANDGKFPRPGQRDASDPAADETESIEPDESSETDGAEATRPAHPDEADKMVREEHTEPDVDDADVSQDDRTAGSGEQAERLEISGDPAERTAESEVPDDSTSEPDDQTEPLETSGDLAEKTVESGESPEQTDELESPEKPAMEPEDRTEETMKSPPHDPSKGKDGRQRRDTISPETPFESRYFTVVIDEEGTIASADLGNIVSVLESDAQEYAQQVFGKNRKRGFQKNFRYSSAETGEGTRLIFLDCKRSLSNFKSFLIYSLLVSAVGYLAVLLLVILLSGRVIRPVQESYEKQKRFITDAGHELKTPLTIIDADVSILEMEHGSSEWIDDIRGQTKRLTQLTNDLIFLSKMEEEQTTLQKIVFPISDVVTETAQSFRSRAQLEEKNFVMTVEPMLSYEGDESRIRQLVTILLDNALKYSEKEGTIELQLFLQGKNTVLSVYNTTAEMKKEDLTHLFDRFYRTDRSRNSATGGHGIGLSIALAIVNAHKGRITADSEDGKSLRITVIL